MKTKLNGNLKWVLTTTAGLIASGAVLGYVVKEMRPEVKENTEHRIKFEEKVANIERDIAKILKAVE